MGLPWKRAPVRIFGPCRSARTEMGLPCFREIARRALIRCECSEWVSWEKFSRATFIPQCTSFSIISGEDVTGPRVQTIFALRRFSGVISLRKQLYCLDHIVSL